MNRKKTQRLIDSLPRPLHQGVKSGISLLPDRFIQGTEYVEKRKFLKESQWWSQEELRSYQNQKLRELIEHAYENVPYYQRIFDQRGLKPEDIQTRDDLEKLPCLTKSDIRENYEDLIAQNVSKTVQKQTSGSTGQPFTFEEPPELGQIERAFINRAFQNHGTDLYHEKTIWLRSYSPSENEPIYKHAPHLNILYLSPFHLSRERISEYVDHIKSFGGDALIGYPSSIYIFATLLEKTEYDLTGIDVVHTGSENMPKAWRERIKSILGVPVKDHYGMAEKVGLFHQCLESDAYHENPEYGIIEVVDRDGDTGKIVGTSLWNYAMPLMRYRMSDRATVKNDGQTCTCGRGLPLSMERFEGRADDIIKTPDGRMLPGVNFYTLMYEVDGIDMFKIIQNELDRVIVRLVVDSRYDDNKEVELERGLQQRLGPEVMIDIEYVDMIERDKDSGKIRCIQSNIE